MPQMRANWRAVEMGSVGLGDERGWLRGQNFFTVASRIWNWLGEKKTARKGRWCGSYLIMASPNWG